MNNIKAPYNFKTLYKQSFDRNPLIDFRKFEAYFSLICSFVFSVLGIILLNTNEIETVVSVIQQVLLGTAIALLGMLGFIVSGLAIIAGTIGSKVAKQMETEGKFGSLINILFSFYFIGFIIGILIVAFFFSYFLTTLGLSFNAIIYVIFTFILAYGFFFAVFYAVSLLGTSLNIFVINYNYSKGNSNFICGEVNNYLTDFKIDALTLLLVKKMDLSKDEFVQTLLDCIERDCPQKYKDEVIRAAETYYSVKR